MERKDNTIDFLIRVILFNNRIQMYRNYILEAKRHGYQVCSMEQFWQDKESTKKHFILRHDVDHVSKGTYKMYKIERDCGVVSTYYFRKNTIDEKLMRNMQKNGFEVGLHYETLSDYADENNLDAVSDGDILICRERLKQEIKEFQKILPKKLSSICSHGASANRRICCSNNILLEGEDYKDYGIIFEAYDKEMYEKYINEHIMDNNICINYGFSYKANPIEAIKNGKKNIIFLTHPNHWYQGVLRSIKDFIKIVLGKCTYTSNRVFVRCVDGRK